MQLNGILFLEFFEKEKMMSIFLIKGTLLKYRNFRHAIEVYTICNLDPKHPIDIAVKLKVERKSFLKSMSGSNMPHSIFSLSISF